MLILFLRSVSYNTKTKTCYLHYESRISFPSAFKKNAQFYHWHIACHDSYCFKEYPFRYLNNQHFNSFVDGSEFSCKSICLKTQGCKSAYFNIKKKTCYLSKETKLTKPTYYKANNDMVYWEREAVCQPTCYMKQYDKRYIMGRNNKVIKSQNSLDCKQFCLTEKSFDCKSVEFNIRSKECYLSTENRASVPTLWRTSSQYTYFEKQCTQAYPCFKKDDGYYLQNKYYKVINGVSEEDCAYQCEFFHCTSANYHRITRICYLSKFTKKNYPKLYKTNNFYVYLEKKESCKPDCQYKKYTNRYLSGFNDVVKKVGSEKECVKLCMKNRDTCRSADYLKLNRNCYLSSKTQVDGNGLATNIMYNHYEHICGEEIEDKGCFTVQKRKYIPGSTKKTLNGQTEQSCLKACLLANFQCR